MISAANMMSTQGEETQFQEPSPFLQTHVHHLQQANMVSYFLVHLLNINPNILISIFFQKIL